MANVKGVKLGSTVAELVADINGSLSALNTDKAEKTEAVKSVAITVDDEFHLTVTATTVSGKESASMIDLPLESVVVGGEYDEATKEVVLTLQNGETVRFSVADLISGLASDAAVAAETERAKEAEGHLSEDVATAQTMASNAQDAADAEQARATEAERYLTSGVTSVQNAVKDEQSRAEAAEQTNADAIEAEQTRAKAEEARLDEAKAEKTELDKYVTVDGPQTVNGRKTFKSGLMSNGSIAIAKEGVSDGERYNNETTLDNDRVIRVLWSTSKQYDYLYPDKSGTFAMTSDVDAAQASVTAAVEAEAARAQAAEQANADAASNAQSAADAAQKAADNAYGWADDAMEKALVALSEADNAGTFGQDAQKAADAVAKRVTDIESKIPAQASATNQLADKAFVNSSIAQTAANRVTATADGDPFATHAALKAATTYYHDGKVYTLTAHDYAVVSADEDAPAPFTGGQTRYEWTGSAWSYAYGINDRPLTAAERAAIESGITSAGVSQIGTNKADIAAIKAKDAEQDKALTDIDNRFATNESNIDAIHADAAQAQAAAEAAQAAADKAQETADGARAAADTAKEKADAAQATADGKQDPISVTSPLTKSGNTIGLTTTATPTSGSGTPITSGGVYTELGKKQDKLTAGTGITIEGTTISATGLEIPIDDKLNTTSLNPVQNKVVATALDGKQDTLTVSAPLTKVGNSLGISTTATPTSGSSTPITSGGVYTALAKKQDTINVSSPLTKSGSTLGLSTTSSATSGSATPITSGGVHSAILAAFPVGSVYLSMKRQSPASIIGGTWQSIAGGKAFWTETLPNTTTPTYWITGSTTAPTPTQLPTLAAGLPNITGDIDTLTSGPTVNSTKALTATDAGTNHFASNSNTNYYHYWKIAVDASRSNTIYGNSTTVQPPAYKVYAWYRTA